MGVADGNVKKKLGRHNGEEGTAQSVLQGRMASSVHHDSVCTVGWKKEEALGIGSILSIENH